MPRNKKNKNKQQNKQGNENAKQDEEAAATEKRENEVMESEDSSKDAKDEKNSTADESQDKEKEESSTGGDTMNDESNDSSNAPKKEENGDAKVESSKQEDENQIENHEGVKVLLDVFTKELPTPTDAAPASEKAEEPSKENAEASKQEAPAGTTASGPAAKPIGPAVPTDKDYDPEEIKKADAFKVKGNEFFKDGKYDEALEAYSEAIFCNVPPKQKAIYYSNRALVSIKTENYALALFDAEDAIKCDEMYVKAYYRRGSAHLALNQVEKALKDFKQVCKMQPGNKDAREKFDETMKEYRIRQLQNALGYANERVTIDTDVIQVEASYKGPKLEKVEDITSDWVQSLMEWQRDRKVLHKKYACMIVMKARELFEADKSLVDITRGDDEEITVCGDIHGQYYDLLNIFKLNGIPSKENPYLFNGDFIDRGSFSVEVIMSLLSWKVCYPEHFFMSRGNHETAQLNKLYGFYGEVQHKYDTKVYDLFNDLFQHLPLSHCINKKVFVTHGGLFAKDGVKLEDIRKTPRVKEPGDEGIMVDCLWSDPNDNNGRAPSKRGISCMFGPDVTQRFLDDNDLKLVVRSHEVKPEGYEYQKGGKCLTVFSAPNYCDQMGNKGAFVRFKGSDMDPMITSFEKVDHPKIPPMAYARGFGGLF